MKNSLVRNMTVGELETILKKIDNKELPVLLPLYDDTQDVRNPINHLHARFAGIIYNEEGDKAFTFGTSVSDTTRYADTLIRTDSRLDRQLFPKDVKQLITLNDYLNAGFGNHVLNGFDIYDYDIEDEHGNDVKLSDITIFSNILVYGDCIVKSIASDPYDAVIPAVYISTRKLRKDASITPERYLDIIRAEEEASKKDAFTKEFVDLFHIKAYVPEEDNTENE